MLNGEFIESFIHDGWELEVPGSFYRRIKEVAGLSEEEISDFMWTSTMGERLPEKLRRKYRSDS